MIYLMFHSSMIEFYMHASYLLCSFLLLLFHDLYTICRDPLQQPSFFFYHVNNLITNISLHYYLLLALRVFRDRGTCCEFGGKLFCSFLQVDVEGFQPDDSCDIFAFIPLYSFDSDLPR